MRRYPPVVDTSTARKTPLPENVIYMEGSRDTSMAEVAMQYTI